MSDVKESDMETNPLLRRAFLFLEDGKWAEASEYCERALDQEPENARAYLGKLMADVKARKPYLLIYSTSPLDSNDNYQKVLRFGDEDLVKEVTDYNVVVRDRCNEYGRAVNSKRSIASVGELEKSEYYGRILSLSLAAMLLLFLLIPTVFCGVHVSLLNFDIVFSGAANTFWSIAAITAIGSIAAFVAYAIVQIRNLKAAETVLARTLRIVYYVICALTVVLLYIAVKDMSSAYGSIAGISGDAADIVNNALDKASDIVNDALGNAGNIGSIANDALNNVAGAVSGAAGLIGIAVLEDAWYFAAGLSVIGLLTAFIPSMMKKKVWLIVIAIILTVCLILFFVFCFGTVTNTAGAPSFSGIQQDVAAMTQDALSNLQPGAADVDANGADSSNKDTGNSGGTGTNNGSGNTDKGSGDSGKSSSESVTITIKVGNYIGLTYSDALISALNSKHLNIGNVNFAPSAKPYGTVIGQYPKEGEKVNAGSKVDLTISDGSLNSYNSGYETITFGYYEQDNNYYNGTEPIEWIVLEKQGNKALIVSKYLIDSQRYNETYANVTWETCTLRAWLNDTFLNTAFNSNERSRIIPTKVSADKNPDYKTRVGNATTDSVFLLSVSEVEEYFPYDGVRLAATTNYAVAEGGYRSDTYYTAEGDPACWWWLRTPGAGKNSAARVSSDGTIRTNGNKVGSVGGGIRPAMWITL